MSLKRRAEILVGKFGLPQDCCPDCGYGMTERNAVTIREELEPETEAEAEQLDQEETTCETCGRSAIREVIDGA